MQNDLSLSLFLRLSLPPSLSALRMCFRQTIFFLWKIHWDINVPEKSSFTLTESYRKLAASLEREAVNKFSFIPLSTSKKIIALKKIIKYTLQSTLGRLRATAMCPLETLKRLFLNNRQDGEVQRWTHITKGGGGDLRKLIIAHNSTRGIRGCVSAL